jgi:hypothetical protein
MYTYRCIYVYKESSDARMGIMPFLMVFIYVYILIYVYSRCMYISIEIYAYIYMYLCISRIERHSNGDYAFFNGNFMYIY